MAGRSQPGLKSLNQGMFHKVDHITEGSLPIIQAAANGYSNLSIGLMVGRSAQGVKNVPRLIYARLGISALPDYNERVLLSWWWWNVGIDIPVKRTVKAESHGERVAVC